MTLFDVKINFKDASIEWNKNKRKIGNMYRYTCDYIFKNGKICGRDCNKYIGGKYCRYHKKYNIYIYIYINE